MDSKMYTHYKPKNFSDLVAFSVTKLLRLFAYEIIKHFMKASICSEISPFKVIVYNSSAGKKTITCFNELIP